MIKSFDETWYAVTLTDINNSSRQSQGQGHEFLIYRYS